ncbi:hypothetical protein [Paenibacillus sp. MY03]|uniref:hypothetical protein n=1 Tax=Paenibacillus sp. MY03 TaxID=302980 RepID=UPI0015C63553|nr:hypothetical protein [Paenibacillus sp. MY03]
MASPLRMPWGSESRLMMTMAPKQNAAITNITVDVISMQQLKPPIVTYAIAKAIMFVFAVCAPSHDPEKSEARLFHPDEEYVNGHGNSAL